MSRITYVDVFMTGYIETLYFADTGGEGQPDREADLAPATLKSIEVDCKAWWSTCWRHLKKEVPFAHTANGYGVVEMAGKDFYLSRNGHGSGFPYNKNCSGADNFLAVASELYEQKNLYTGDDGLIYFE